MPRPYRILSLDGGGSWALIQALALDAIFPGKRGREVLGNFDLAIANSGGSIVLACLASDMSPWETAQLLRDVRVRRSVFVRTGAFSGSGFLGFLSRAFAGMPRYVASAKLRGLRSAIPDADALLSDLPARIAAAGGKATRLVITTFDYDRLRATFLRSDAASRASTSNPSSPTLAEAVHASTNAPVKYFDAPAVLPSLPDKRFWDGGMGGNNNPVLAGAVEAVANGVAPADIAALSIGTANVMRPLGEFGEHDPLYEPRIRDPVFQDDIVKASTAILDDPPDSASYIAHLMLGGRAPADADDTVTDGPIVRLNPLIQGVRQDDGSWAYPRALPRGEFEALANLDMDAIEPDDVDRIDRLADAWVNDESPNQPVRARQNLTCQIGHAKFSEATAAWSAL